jgi:hypothetical protein
VGVFVRLLSLFVARVQALPVVVRFTNPHAWSIGATQAAPWAGKPFIGGGSNAGP